MNTRFHLSSLLIMQLWIAICCLAAAAWWRYLAYNLGLSPVYIGKAYAIVGVFSMFAGAAVFVFSRTTITINRRVIVALVVSTVIWFPAVLLALSIPRGLPLHWLIPFFNQ